MTDIIYFIVINIIIFVEMVLVLLAGHNPEVLRWHCDERMWLPNVTPWCLWFPLIQRCLQHSRAVKAFTFASEEILGCIWRPRGPWGTSLSLLIGFLIRCIGTSKPADDKDKSDAPRGGYSTDPLYIPDQPDASKHALLLDV